MELSDFFIDPTTLPDGICGFIQLLMLLVGYGYVLFVASNMISDGSELLLLIPSISGVVGSCILPILGAVPDGMIVLFSGMGDDAQNQLDVGVGALAGSTIMLLTLPWSLSVYAGRVNIENGEPVYTARGRKAQGPCTGIANSSGIRKGGFIMMITSISYVLLQGPAFFFAGETTAEVASSEKGFAMVGLVLCVLLFAGYIIYQFKLSQSGDDDVATQIHFDMIVKQLNEGQLTLKGALYYELTHNNEQQLGTYQACAKSSSTQLWETIPPASKQRISRLLKYFFVKHVKNGTDVDISEMSKIFLAMGENVRQDDITHLFQQFDTDRSGTVNLNEFTVGVIEYIASHFDEVKRSLNETDNEIFTQVDGGNDEEQDEEDEVMPDDLVNLPADQQMRKVIMRSVNILGLGAILVVLFSDPMTDVLSELGVRTGVPAFYISFVLAPLASNASELIASYSYAAKKSAKSISIALQALQGAACLNNTFCLAVFMGLIFFQGLAWQYSAETFAILLGQFCIALISCKKLQTMADVCVVLSIYPMCLLAVATLEAMGFD